MFGIGPPELIVIIVLAIILLGPEKFPEAGRAVGKAIREFRSMSDDLTRDFRQPLEEISATFNSWDESEDDRITASVMEQSEEREGSSEYEADQPLVRARNKNRPGPV